MNLAQQIALKEIITVHYGEPLRQEERKQKGSFAVYGSNGCIGNHDECVVSCPTIIIGRKGSVGEIIYAPNGGWPIDTTFYVEILKQNEVDLKYLYYALKKANLGSKKITTSIPGLNRDEIYRTLIYLPPLPEQRRIATILDKADAIRRKRTETIKLLDQFLRSVFLEMFGDPNTNPKGWQKHKLDQIGTLDRGKSKHRPRNAPELLGGVYPLVQTGDVANCGGYITKYEQTYSELGLKQSRMWPKGTLCITIAANIAKTGILTFDACFPDSIVGFTPSKNVRTEYVQFWLSFLQKKLEETAPESAQKNINLRILRNLDVPLPPLDLQNKFISVVIRNKKIKENMEHETAELGLLFDSLAQRAFRGEL